MDRDAETPSVEERLREVARSRAIAAALLHGAAAAEVDDVLQEASVAALAPDAPRGEAFARWIRGAVRHLSVTVLRRRERRQQREREAARPVALPTAADVAHRLALQRVLLAEVEALAEPIRTAIVRRYLDAVPPRRIASEQRVPLATVKTRLRRGLAQLRERLQREWGEELAGALLLLSRPVGGAAAGCALAEAVGLSLPVKLAAVVLLLVAGTAATIGLTRHFSSVSDDSDFGDVAAAAANGVGPRDAESPGVAGAAVGASEAKRVATALDDPIPGSRRARIGARRVASLMGRVVDPRGRIVVGAEIEAVRLIADELRIPPTAVDDLAAGEPIRTKSGRDGTFCFDDLARGATFDLFAIGRSGRRGVVRGVRVGFADAVVIELQPVTTITGRVVDARDQRPVAGATVRIRNGATDRRHPLVTTADGDGRFTFTGVVGTGVLALAAAPDGRMSGPYTPTFSPGDHVKMEIRVGLAGAGEGKLVDAESGAPIPDATIVLAEWSDLVATHSDEAGHFQIRPPNSPERGVIDVVIAAPGYARSYGELRVAKDADDPLPSTTFKLKRGRVAFGRVESHDGAPIAGALLFAGRAGKGWLTYAAPTTTRDDGSFRIEEIETTTRHVLLLRHDECEWFETPFPDDEAARTEIDLGTICVGRGAVVAGVAIDERGAPLAGIFVTLTPDGREPSGVACDPKGRFEFEGVPAGRSTLKSFADGFRVSAEVALDLKDEEVVESIRLASVGGLEIAGCVTDAAGAPSAGAGLLLRRCEEKGDANREVVAIAHADANGRFRIASLAAGAYRLEVRPEKSTKMRSAPKILERVDAGTSDLVVVLSDAVFATGRVVDGAGEPVAGAMLTVKDVDGTPVAGGNSGRDGSFRIAVPADVELRVEARVFDPRHPRPVSENPVAGSLEHVRGGGTPVTLIVETK